MALKTSRRTILARRKDEQALSMRLKGWTFERIAHELGWADRAVAYNAVKKILDRQARLTKEMAEEYRELQRRRLEELIATLWPHAIPAPGEDRLPNIDCIKEIRALMTQMNTLLGLNAEPFEDAPDDDAGGIPETSRLAHGLLGVLLAGHAQRTIEIDGECVEVRRVLDALAGPAEAGAGERG